MLNKLTLTSSKLTKQYESWRVTNHLTWSLYTHYTPHSFCQLGELDLLASTFFKNHPTSVERHPFSLNTIFSGQLNATLPAQKTHFEDTFEQKIEQMQPV